MKADEEELEILKSRQIKFHVDKCEIIHVRKKKHFTIKQ